MPPSSSSDGDDPAGPTGADAPTIGEDFDGRTHYAHARYAANNQPGIIWFDPRDGREHYALEAGEDDLDDVGDEVLTRVSIKPYRPTDHGRPADQYSVKQQTPRRELVNADSEFHETTTQVATYVETEVFDSLEAAREWCRSNIEGYTEAPRRDAVRSRDPEVVERDDC